LHTDNPPEKTPIKPETPTAVITATKVLTVLQQGITTPEHKAFTARLARPEA
jgi:hypothetical protein